MREKSMDIEKIIFDNMLLDINQGRYLVDSKLPSDNELADMYNVPRMRVRNVYEKLEKMGYIYSLQGRGRYLKNRNKNIKLMLSGEESFSKKMKNQGYKLETKNIFCERIPYNDKIFSQLKASEKDEIYRIGRLRIIDGEPIAIHISYVSKVVFKDIYENGRNIKSMFEYYKSNGFNTFSTIESFLSIEYPTIREQELLKCTELVPILKLETNCVDREKDIVLEYTEIMYRGDCFKYKI